MIFGIGTDIVRVARMQQNLERYQERFAARLLTPAELEDFRVYPKKANFLAKRFAAKEAAAKAIGLGFRHGLHLRDIGVAHDTYGKPSLVFSGFAAKFLEQHGIASAHLSLSDEEDLAIAFVTLETVGTD